jgi:hypothetical protein
MRRLTGHATWWSGVPALVMLALTLAPGMDARPGLRQAVWIAAALSLGLVIVSSRRHALDVATAIRRPHWMQALTQLGVYVFWSLHWEPVAGFALAILVQLAFAFQMDALMAWWHGKPWRVGFGPLPVVLSINLFMWFRDEHFVWQLVMVALCYFAKYAITWRRDGTRCHVFNPSSFGLAVISVGLLATGTAGLTYARDIATTQEAAPHFIVVLFFLGLIVQLQFRVVLVTASAAIATWLLGVAFLQATGVYMFATTDIPAAVFLGMLLLVTDPATSPRGTAAKVLFGAAYGALAFASFPFLESLGSQGYFDKLLPVPLLNLLVHRFDRWGAWIGAKFARARPPRRDANLWHVIGWGAVFAGLWATHAVGPGHPGRDITFWQRACAQDRFRACSTYFNLLTAECNAGRGEACHNLGVELFEREQRGAGVGDRAAAEYFARACELGVELGCAARQGLDARPSPSVAPGPPAPSAPETLAAARLRGCDEGDATACADLAAMYNFGDGVPQDYARAVELTDQACGLGLGVACARLAQAYAQGTTVAIDMERARELSAQACNLGFAPACAPAP